MLKILWKRGEIAPQEQFLLLSTILGRNAPQEQFLLLSTIFCYLVLDLKVKTRIRFSLRDKRLFEITEGEITRVDCIGTPPCFFRHFCKGKYVFMTSYSLSWAVYLFENGIYSLMKVYTPREAKCLFQQSTLFRRKKNTRRSKVASPESVHIRFIFIYCGQRCLGAIAS